MTISLDTSPTVSLVAAAKVSAAALPAQHPKQWSKPLAASSGYVPTHPDATRVVFQESAADGVEAYSSKLIAVRDFAPGELVAFLDNACQAPVKAYSSVQYGPGPNDHLELNSDLLFMNHSCAPSAEVVLHPGAPKRWEVRAGPAGLVKGQDITFFYPSTEWDMAQGFDCNCGAESCLGKVHGAKHHSLATLEARGFVNEHIRALKAAQEA